MPCSRIRVVSCALAVLGAAASASPAWAALTVSSRPTAGVTCASGTCTATSPDAVLDVSDLTALLAAGPVRLEPGTLAQDLVIQAPLAWASGSALTLDAARSITVDAAVGVTGPGGLTMTTNDGGVGGTLSFGPRGHVHFRDLSSALVIDGAAYTLVGSIAELAAGVAARPHGSFALAASYDAHADGSYSRVPVPTGLDGTFEGLGNTISNLAIYDTVDGNVALFASLGHRGVLRDVGVVGVDILSENTFYQIVGGLVAFSQGSVVQCFATGSIRSDFWVTAGGLVGESYGPVSGSFAAVDVSGAVSAEVGGLIGNSHGHVSDVYAVGSVIAGDQSSVGGLIGYNLGRVGRAYSTGSVGGGQGALVGGLMGQTSATVARTYWDTDTSGTTLGDGGTNAAGITGVTTKALQSGLPAGFSAAVWAQSATVNGGLPYLIGAPPR